jgi:hypothetical protein
MADRHDHREEHTNLERPGPGYEVRDVNAWAVSRFGIALVFLCLFAVALLFGLFRYFESTYGGPMPPTGLDMDARALPPSPTLQRTPRLDLQRFRAAEDEVLNSYSWIDQQHGIVHVPIDVAIDILAKQGLPARQQAPPTDKADVPTESGLGPVMQPPGGPLAPELQSSLSAPVSPNAATASPQSRDRKGAGHPPEKP